MRGRRIAAAVALTAAGLALNSPTPAAAEAGEGFLRVTTSPAVPSRILVDGVARHDWSLDGLPLSAGTHEVCFSDVPGFLTPACRSVTISADATTVTQGAFSTLGLLKVETVPAGLPTTIHVDGVPRDEYGLYAFVEPGAHEVCWGDVPGHQAPPCQSVTVVAGAQRLASGQFTPAASPTPGPAPLPATYGYLRVTTDPPVPARVLVDGIARSDWGLNWLKLPAGTYDVCFTAVPGFAPPPCRPVTVAPGAVATSTGSFARLGMLRVSVEPAGLPATVTVAGVARNRYGVYTNIEPGSYAVCGTPVAGRTTPPCSTVAVTAGATTTLTLTYPATPTATPGCGFADAAFCEDFEGARNTAGNRNGDLSTSRFSVSRWRSELGTEPGHVDPAQISSCRAGSSATPLPPGESLVCDQTTKVRSKHALLSATPQNYGDLSVRIAQPFDIANRTGTIRFDASVLPQDNGLIGWPTLAVLADAYNAPSYLADNSNGPTPRQGIQIHFNSLCPGPAGWTAFPKVRTYDRHRETLLTDESGYGAWCTDPITTVAGQLNRVEVRLSTTLVEVWMSDSSADGVTFGPLTKVYSARINLGFSRGYVTFGVHNHASRKYASLPSWTVLWDNIGFDGPKVAPDRVHQVDDAAVASGTGRNLGFWLPNAATGGSTPSLRLDGVSTANATSATLVFDMAADPISNTNWSAWRVNYRLNGGPWRSVGFSADELALMNRAGSYIFSLPVDLGQLVNGANTVQFSGTGFYAGYQPYLGNVDLVLR